MDLRQLYPWLVFLHVLSVLAFLLAHGASVSVAFRIRRERDPERIRALVQLSGGTAPALLGTLLAILVTGAVVGIVGGWFTNGQLWLWISVALLLAIAALMRPLGVMWLDDVRHAVGLPGRDEREPPGGGPSQEAALLRAVASSRPWLLAAVGFGGVAIILWLMMFKPF